MSCQCSRKRHFKCFPKADKLYGWMLARGEPWGLSRVCREERSEGLGSMGMGVVEMEKPRDWELWARCLPVPSPGIV